MKYAFKVTDTSVSDIFEAPDYSLPIRSGGERLKVFEEREKAEAAKRLEEFAFRFSEISGEQLSSVLEHEMSFIEKEWRIGQEALSILTGIPRESLSAWKRGKRKPPYRAVAAIHILFMNCLRFKENNSGMLLP